MSLAPLKSATEAWQHAFKVGDCVEGGGVVLEINMPSVRVRWSNGRTDWYDSSSIVRG